MQWAPLRCGVFVAIAAALACACGARARTCGAPGEGTKEPGPAPGVREIGRWDGGRFAWSGSAFEVRFTGASLAMRLRAAPAPAPDAASTPYTVTVDGQPPTTLDVSTDRERYELASGLDPAKAHVVSVVREAEATAGVHELLGVDLAPRGELLPAPPRPHRIEV